MYRGRLTEGIVDFREEAVKEYLDGAIRHWRKVRDEEDSQKAAYYVDAFQSVRISLFGECLEGD